MAGETFKLNFISNSEGLKSIDEPIGFDTVSFVSKQGSKRLARDVSFAGDEEFTFTFYRDRNHYIDTLLYYYESFGWESKVQLIIEKDGIDNIVGDLDFKEAKTDQLEYFECKVIQDSDQALLKRRREINVDVFSDENVDGGAITPVDTENVLVKAKPISQSSAWETPEAFDERLFAERAISNTIHYTLNPAINLVGYGIDDSLTFFQNIISFSNHAGVGEDFRIIEAQNNLRKINVSISNLDFQLDTDVDNGGDGYAEFRLELRYGLDYDTSQSHIFFSEFIRDTDPLYTNTNNYSFEIPYLSRGDSVWLFYHFKIRQSSNTPFGNPRFEAFTTINSMDVDVTATSIAYNTIVPSVRLYDGVSHVVESISGLSTDFPFAQVNGEMYNQRLFNGNLLRNILNKPFNISLKDIESWLPEIYGDYEVQNDGSVFFGLYADYYQNKEIGVFTDVRFDTYKKTFNSSYAINEFNYKYKKYQSQKENEVENTFDVVHGESQWSVLNKFVENRKSVDVAFVRDSFFIDEQRRKAFNLDDNTSTQDDDTIFILDTLEASGDSIFTETDFLQHTYNEDTGYLKLTNTGKFNFALLGLAVGETFEILGGDSNTGTYTIIEIKDRYIIIDSGLGSTNNNGERTTQFQYIVSTTTAPYISWSNEGFNYIDNIIDGDNFANLKYTIKRNIKRFYNQYLATCNYFAKKDIKNTLYKNNESLSLSYEGEQSVEGDPFTPNNPILSPYEHYVTIITDFNTFIDLQNKSKTEKGFIRTYDANGHVIKIFPKEMTFENTDEYGQLTILGEEKHQTSLINITYSAELGYVIINDEYRMQKLSYSQDGEKFYIMDDDGRLLYNPVFWHKITVNDATPSNKTELIEWLDILK